MHIKKLIAGTLSLCVLGGALPAAQMSSPLIIGYAEEALSSVTTDSEGSTTQPYQTLNATIHIGLHEVGMKGFKLVESSINGYSGASLSQFDWSQLLDNGISSTDPYIATAEYNESEDAVYIQPYPDAVGQTVITFLFPDKKFELTVDMFSREPVTTTAAAVTTAVTTTTATQPYQTLNATIHIGLHEVGMKGFKLVESSINGYSGASLSQFDWSQLLDNGISSTDPYIATAEYNESEDAVYIQPYPDAVGQTVITFLFPDKKFELTVDMFSLEPTTVPTGPVVYGDVTEDGKIDLNDAVAILQYAALPAKYPLEGNALEAADVVDNGTSGITGHDALAIMMIDAKLIAPKDLPLSSADIE